MGLCIYNSLSRNKEPFVPMQQGKVGLYVCGPTVYDLSHVGHARVYVAFDTIVRFLRTAYDVTYVRNFTDIDDKIIARAHKEQLTASDVSEHNIAEFRRDMHSLDVAAPDFEPKVTEHIEEIVALCQSLLDLGVAYAVSGDLYFAVEKFEGYGKLGRRSLEDMEAGIRVEVNSQKRHPMDFVLWKAAKPGEPAWEAPWGRGRPGWHIECSAMSKKYLGTTFDLHGGGRDLMFPHHENEVAQSEAAHKAPFSRCWLHGGLVNINNEKMSKSLGNFFTIRQVLDKFDARALRYMLLATHYRSPIAFSDLALKEAQSRIAYCFRTLCRLEEAVGPAEPPNKVVPKAANNSLRADAHALAERFVTAMQDDFNTPEAIGTLAVALTTTNDLLDHPQSTDLDQQTLRYLQQAIVWMGSILGLSFLSPGSVIEKLERQQQEALGIDPEKVEAKLAQRQQARADKDFAKADAIRDELLQMGVVILDRHGKTQWRLA